jgi:hypothetical protein
MPIASAARKPAPRVRFIRAEQAVAPIGRGAPERDRSHPDPPGPMVAAAGLAGTIRLPYRRGHLPRRQHNGGVVSMNRVQFWIVTGMAALALPLAVAAIVLAQLNRGLQGEIAQRQQYVQQSVQLEGLYREIVRALAELGARNNDEAVRLMLARHGITYTVNAPPAAAQPPAAPARK